MQPIDLSSNTFRCELNTNPTSGLPVPFMPADLQIGDVAEDGTFQASMVRKWKPGATNQCEGRAGDVGFYESSLSIHFREMDVAAVVPPTPAAPADPEHERYTVDRGPLQAGYLLMPHDLVFLQPDISSRDAFYQGWVMHMDYGPDQQYRYIGGTWRYVTHWNTMADTFSPEYAWGGWWGWA